MTRAWLFVIVSDMNENESLSERICLALGPYCSEELAQDLNYLDETPIASLEASPLSELAAHFHSAIESMIAEGDMRQLAEMMSCLGADFDKDKFLSLVLSDDGELLFSLGEENYREMVAEVAREEVDLESLSMQYFFDEESGMDPEASMFAQMEEEILAEIIDDPSGNPHFYLQVPSMEEWLVEQRRKSILLPWIEAGGTEPLLSASPDTDGFLDIVSSWN